MELSSSNSRGEGHAKTRRKAREELDQEARGRKRQKRRCGHAPGSRTVGGDTASGNRSQSAPEDPRIGSKTPISLGMTEKVAKRHKLKNEKSMLSPQAELELLETDERLDALLERLKASETLSAEEQSWVDARPDHIDESMQKLGLSYDGDEKEEEDGGQEDMVRLLRGN